MPGGDQGWFVVLADRDAALGVAQVLYRRSPPPQVVTHASGRPWLIGRWAESELVLARVGEVQVAVLGCCPVTATVLSAAASHARTAHDLDRLAARLPGSFHLLAAIEGKARVQGSVSGLRRVFRARIAGVTVAADRADILADLAGAAVDERWLATRLMYPLVPHPLADWIGWHGVRAVTDGCYLLINPDGTDRVVQWWSPPEPSLPLVEGAPIVREALCAAVAARTRAGGTISADLSGGLDSTPLCLLAARSTARVIAVTVGGADPGNDDLRWARPAASALDGVEHLVFHPHELPAMYEDLNQAGDGQDSPLARVRINARDTHIARLLVGCGSRLHLAGHGGDEVLQAPPDPCLHTTAWAHPRIAASHLQGHRAWSRWPLPATLRALADRRTYAEWLAANADKLNVAPPSPRTPDLGWGPALRLPPWATVNAAGAAASLLRQAAATAEPLAPTRGQHAALQMVRFGASVARHLAQIMARAGLPMALPYFDDRVVEACLAVRLHERTTPWRYKPLLVEALRDVVPAAVLQRTTKGGFGADVHAGLRRHRADLAALCDDSVLARLGLVDAGALRAACLGMHPPTLSLPALEATLGCEAWLRAQSLTASASGFHTGASR